MQYITDNSNEREQIKLIEQNPSLSHTRIKKIVPSTKINHLQKKGKIGLHSLYCLQCVHLPGCSKAG